MMNYPERAARAYPEIRFLTATHRSAKYLQLAGAGEPSAGYGFKLPLQKKSGCRK
jgi:hypothetical protein